MVIACGKVDKKQGKYLVITLLTLQNELLTG